MELRLKFGILFFRIIKYTIYISYNFEEDDKFMDISLC